MLRYMNRFTSVPSAHMVHVLEQTTIVAINGLRTNTLTDNRGNNCTVMSPFRCIDMKTSMIVNSCIVHVLDNYKRLCYEKIAITKPITRTFRPF